MLLLFLLERTKEDFLHKGFPTQSIQSSKLWVLHLNLHNMHVTGTLTIPQRSPRFLFCQRTDLWYTCVVGPSTPPILQSPITWLVPDCYLLPIRSRNVTVTALLAMWTQPQPVGLYLPVTAPLRVSMRDGDVLVRSWGKAVGDGVVPGLISALLFGYSYPMRRPARISCFVLRSCSWPPPPLSELDSVVIVFAINFLLLTWANPLSGSIVHFLPLRQRTFAFIILLLL